MNLGPRAAVTRRGVSGEAWQHRQQVKAWHRSCSVKRAACRLERRRAVHALVSTATLRCKMPLLTLPWCAAAGKKIARSLPCNWSKAPVSRLQ